MNRTQAVALLALAAAPLAAGPGFDFRDPVFSEERRFWRNPEGGHEEAPWVRHGTHVNVWMKQRYRITGGLMDRRVWAESEFTLDATPEEVVAELRKKWTWYGGLVERWHMDRRGRANYLLWPAGKLLGAGIHVREQMYPPMPLHQEPDGDHMGDGYRIPIRFLEWRRLRDGFYPTGTNVLGLATIDVRTNRYFAEFPEKDHPRTRVYARFVAVQEKTAFPAEAFVKNHLDAERGRLRIAGVPTDTRGFRGLRELLEARRRRERRARRRRARFAAMVEGY